MQSYDRQESSGLQKMLSQILAEADSRGISTKELAEMAHLRPETISRLKNRSDAEYSTLRKLAEPLGLEIALVRKKKAAQSQTEHKPNLELPKTSYEHYLTGRTALNIPSPEGTSGDWHLNEAFYGRGDRRAKLFLAGEGEELNTNPVLGRYGVWECSNTLRRFGIAVPKNTKVYSANHYRAILDMVYKAAKKKRRPDHIEVNSWLDSSEEKKILAEKITELKKYLDQDEWQTVNTWWQSHH